MTRSRPILNAHPKARLNAAFSKQHSFWIVEVVEGDKEVGFVSVSDQTGEVLEVEIEQPTQNSSDH